MLNKSIGQRKQHNGLQKMEHLDKVLCVLIGGHEQQHQHVTSDINHEHQKIKLQIILSTPWDLKNI